MTESLSSSGGKPTPDFEWIVNDPLHAGKGTYHENSSSNTFPESIESNFTIDFFNLSSSSLFRCSSLVKNGNHGISWMRNNSTEDTSKVTRHKGNHKLSTLTIWALLFSENFLIELLYNSLKSNEFNNCVWNLSCPKWCKTFIESVHAFCCVNLIQSFDCTSSECTGFRCLHFNFKLYPSYLLVRHLILRYNCFIFWNYSKNTIKGTYSFPWAEEYISNDFCAGWRYSKTKGLIFLDCFLIISASTSVNILEDFIESEFTETLEWVTDPCWKEPL